MIAVGRATGAAHDDLSLSLQTEISLALLSTLDRWALTALPALDLAESADLSQLQIDLIETPARAVRRSSGKNIQHCQLVYCCMNAT